MHETDKHLPLNSALGVSQAHLQAHARAWLAHVHEGRIAADAGMTRKQLAQLVRNELVLLGNRA